MNDCAKRPGKPFSLLDTRVVYGCEIWGDNLEQPAKLPDASVCDRCVDLIYIDPPFNSNRTVKHEGEVFWGETKEKRAFEAVMEREGRGPTGETGRQRGFFVSFGYSRDAHDECAAFHRRTGRLIKLLTVQEILDEEHVQKM